MISLKGSNLSSLFDDSNVTLSLTYYFLLLVPLYQFSADFKGFFKLWLIKNEFCFFNCNKNLLAVSDTRRYISERHPRRVCQIAFIGAFIWHAMFTLFIILQYIPALYLHFNICLESRLWTFIEIHLIKNNIGYII